MKTYKEYVEKIKTELVPENKSVVDKMMNRKASLIENKIKEVENGKQKGLSAHFRRLDSAWKKHCKYCGSISLEEFMDKVNQSGLKYILLAKEFIRQGIHEKAF